MIPTNDDLACVFVSTTPERMRTLRQQGTERAFAELHVHDRSTPEQAIERLQGAQVAISNKVPLDATKPEIKAAVELMFKVEVDSVKVANVKGKEKRFGRFMGRRDHWKKAYVCLKPGQEINFADGESK